MEEKHAVLFVCLFTFSKASVVIFEKSPNDVTEYLTPELNLTCDLQHPFLQSSSADIIGRRDVKDNYVINTGVPTTDVTNNSTPNSDVTHVIQHVTSIAVSRGNGTIVASMTLNNSPRPFVDPMSLSVTGDLTAGVFHLSWSTPTKAQAGDYTCSVVGLDVTGHTRVLTKTLHADVKSPTVTELTKEIYDIKEDNNHIQTELTTLLSNIQTLQNNSFSHASPLSVCNDSIQGLYEYINITLLGVLHDNERTHEINDYFNRTLETLITTVQDIHAPSMKIEINNMTLMLEEFQTSSHLMKDDIALFKNSIDKMFGKITKIADNVSSIGLDVDLLKIEDSFFKEEINMMQNETLKMQTQIETVTQENRLLKEEVSELQNDKVVMENILLNLTAVLDHLPMQQINNSLIHEYNNSSCSACDSTDLKSKVDILENKLYITEVDMSNLKTENANLRTQTNEIENELNAVKSFNDVLNVDNKMIQSEVYNLNQEVANLNERVNQLLSNTQLKPHIEQGEVSCGDSSTQWGGREGQLWFTTRTIYFSRGYNSSPHVHIGVTKYNQEQKGQDNPFFEVQITDVSADRFMVRCVVWQWVHVWDVRFRWISFSQD